jgi:ketosteroid isomerase-like protein
MSRESVAKLSEILELFRQGDRESWRNYFAEDVVWDVSRSAMPNAGVYHGHEGVERFFGEWLRIWDDYSIELLDMIDAGDSVIVLFRQRGRGRASGVETQRDFVGVYDMRDGMVTRYRQFETLDEARAEAGLAAG